MIGHHCTILFRFVFRATCVLLALSSIALAAGSECVVVNLMPEFWRVVDESAARPPGQQIRTFRKVLVERNPSLFKGTGLGFESDEKLDSAILTALSNGRIQRNSIRAATDRLQAQLPFYISAFKAAFPDFGCDFPIYIVSSLGALDGAGRVVHGRPSLILGADVIAQENLSSSTLRILIDHELFHRYQYEVAGFSDDNAQHEVIWKGLWAEGLATYVSMKLNSPATLQDALIAPNDLVMRATPILPQLIPELKANLDTVDSAYFSKLFTYRGAHTNPPSRVGYLIGALAAEQMAKSRSLVELAHMQPNMVRPELARALDQVCAGSEKNGN